jgi:hypothetical protein
MSEMTDRPRIQMGEAPKQAQKLAEARRHSGEYNAAQFEHHANLIGRAAELCFDPSKTNTEVAHTIGVTRRQVSRLRHGSQAAWNRLA